MKLHAANSRFDEGTSAADGARVVHSSHRGRVAAGFTLMELILVMVIMVVAMAMAAPGIQGWNQRWKLRDAGDDFVAATRSARMQAASEGALHALRLDRQSATIQIVRQHGEEFVAANGVYGQGFQFPEGVRLDAVNFAGQTIDVIYFQPTGRVDPARVTLLSDNGQTLEIECRTQADDFAVVQTGDMR